jgi:hypothetical protein
MDLPIGRLTPARNLQNQYQVVPVINIINHPVVAYPDAVSIFCASYLPDSPGARVVDQAPDGIQQSLKVLHSNSAL